MNILKNHSYNYAYSAIVYSQRLIVVSRQHETSSIGVYARWSLLRRNQAQTAKEASREKISTVPAIFAAKNYSTTLVDDHCSLHLPRPQALWSSNQDDISLVHHLYLMLPAIFTACKCNKSLLYNHGSAEVFYTSSSSMQ